MLVAHNKDGQRVLARHASKLSSYTCPECSAPLIVKQGREIVWHFAHKIRAGCEAEGETLEHLAMKQWAYDTFRRLPGVTVCEIEWPLLHVRRRADVYIEAEWGRVAVECQVSNMNYDELHAKIAAYRQVDIATLYIISRERVVSTGWRDLRSWHGRKVKPRAFVRYLLALYGILYVYQPPQPAVETTARDILPAIAECVIPVYYTPKVGISVLQYIRELTMHCGEAVDVNKGLTVDLEKGLAWFTSMKESPLSEHSQSATDDPLLQYVQALQRIEAARLHRASAQYLPYAERLLELDVAFDEIDAAFSDLRRARTQLDSLGIPHPRILL